MISNQWAAVELREERYVAYRVGQQGAFAAYAQAESVDGRRIDTRTARRTGKDIQSFTDALGKGTRLCLSFAMDNGLMLTQIVALYDDHAEMMAHAVLSDVSGNVATRWIAPLVGVQPNQELPAFMRSHGVRMMLAPYDNDMWVRYESVPMRPGRTSYDVTALYAPDRGNGGIVIGSIDHGVWKSALTCSAYDARALTAYCGVADANTHDSMPHGVVSGREVASARFMVGYYDDVRDGLERYGLCCKAANAPLAWT